MKAIAIIRVRIEDPDDFYKRRKEYERKEREYSEAYANRGRKRVLTKIKAELQRMGQPLFSKSHYEFLDWEKPPKSKRRQAELEKAIRLHELPDGARLSIIGFPLNPNLVHDGEKMRIFFP